VSQATLYRLIATYKATGTVEALMPRTRGRPTGLRLLDKKVEALISKCIREIYLTPNRPTLKRLTDEVHAKCASVGFSLPDRRTIRARVLAIPERTRALRRADTAGVKATTQTPGSLVATRPLEVVQIDHTEVDVVVVDEEKRQPLPGRPWLTLAIDVFSRMVTGFHLSMSEPSRLSMGLCMLRATFDKTEWLKDHDVSEEWPTVGLPEMIGVDNGSDFKSATFRRACENEGIRVEFRPPGRPHYGGHIERRMGTMMKDVHALPGTTLRQGAGLLILQRVISFCEDWISARVELQLCNQERTVAIAVHRFEPCAQRRGQLVWGETDDPLKFRHIALHVDAQQLEEDRLFALEIGIDCTLRVAGLRRYQVNRRAAVSVAG
jgi:putative transposase